MSRHNNEAILDNIMAQLDYAMSGAPHSLIELSNKQWTRMKSNSIIVSDMVELKLSTGIKRVAYNNIVMGNKVVLRKHKSTSNGTHQ